MDLLAEDAEAFGIIHIGLGAGRGFDAAKRHLRAQRPAGWQLPAGLDLGIDQRVVVLQRGADAAAGQRGPDRQLGHAGAVFGKGREVVCVERELLLQALDHGLVFKKQHAAKAGLEAVDLLLGGWEVFCRCHGAQRLQHDLAPQCLMFGTEQDHGTRALRVEGGGRLAHRFLDQRRQFGRGLLDLAANGVDAATLLQGADDGMAHEES